MYRFSQNIKGNLVYPASASGVNVRLIPLSNGQIVRAVAYSVLAGTTTGSYALASDGYWIEIINNNQKAWVRYNVVTVKSSEGKVLKISFPNTSSTSTQETESLSNIDRYMRCEQQVFTSLSKCRAFVALCARKNMNSFQYLSLKKQTEDLSSRYNTRQVAVERQQQLKVERAQSLEKVVEKVVENVVSMPVTPTYFSGQIGFSPAVFPLIVPVIKFVLVGIAAVTLWVLLKKNSDESQADLKISQNLEKALGSLSPKERDAVEKNLQKQIDKAYQKGSNSTMLGMILTGVKIIAIGAVGFLLAKKILKKE